MPIVTVGLPVYNAAPYLADSIQSVINQTCSDWELIIVDDGSSDNSLAIAQSFTDPRIQVFADGQHLGGAARRNQINQMAQGRFVAILDADDIMTPGRLFKQINWLNKHVEIDIVGSLLYTINVNNNVYGIRGSTYIPEIVNDAVIKNPIAQPTIMARRSWFLANPYNEKIGRCYDFELWLRTIEQSRFAVIDKPLIFYRELGVPYLRKYTRGINSIHRILRHYKQQHKIKPATYIKAQIYYFIKGLIYRILAVFNFEDWLLRRRSKSLSSEEQIIVDTLLLQSITRRDPYISVHQ